VNGEQHEAVYPIADHRSPITTFFSIASREDLAVNQ
jgi:hypothetical protein